jgi:hypothetical protein
LIRSGKGRFFKLRKLIISGLKSALIKNKITIRTMIESERKIIKKWIDVWKETDKALQEIKIQELRSEDYYEKNKQFLNEMLQYAFEHRTVRLSSGLVEQQKFFMKLRKESN